MTQGRIHDFKLLALSNERVKTVTKTGVDSGYQGLQKEHANREQSRERIPVENVIGCIKRFRILSERYRCRRKRFGLRINLISGIYNFEIDLASDTVNPVST